MATKKKPIDPETFDQRDFTRACDLIRSIAGNHSETEVGKLSRSDASRIRMTISSVLGLDDMEVAKKLADHYKSLGNL